MKYAIIEDGAIVNVIEAEKEFVESLGAVYCGELTIGIGDSFVDNQFRRTETDYDTEGKEIGEHYEYFDIPAMPQEFTATELREQAYETMLYKEDGTELITWNETAITVDTANKKWLDYSAEGNIIANELSAQIVSAKAYIRELYLDR